jgi:nitric oxide reductase NorQ protein
MAACLERTLYTVSCHEETSAVDLIGRYLLLGDETIWQDGPMTRAVREGAILYLDEVAEARPDVIVAIHSLTDHRRELYIDRRNERLKAADGFMLVASFNPDYQSGNRELKPSTRQRFIGMSFDYPDQSVEAEIVRAETGAEPALCDKLVQLAANIRRAILPGLQETVSTRLLVDAAALAASGIPPRLACTVAITEPLTDDRQTAAALNDMIALLF